jgi:hypothetical protein
MELNTEGLPHHHTAVSARPLSARTPSDLEPPLFPPNGETVSIYRFADFVPLESSTYKGKR